VSAPSAAQPSSERSDSGSGWPSTMTRVRGWRYRARRARLGSTVTLVIATLLLGIAIGRWTAPPPDHGARGLLEDRAVPLALDADGVWTSSSDGRVPVSEALVALRDGDPSLVEESGRAWLAAYDATLRDLAALELPAEGRPVQRQFIAAITLSRDAVEVLVVAAQVEGAARERLLTEVGRLRVRGEQLTQAARASIADVGGHGGEVSRLPDLPPFPPVEPAGG
jgi:hypothetical protein